MPVAIITGSGGLIGSESVSHFVQAGFDVVGIDNDMRATFFGAIRLDQPQTRRLEQAYPSEFHPLDLDIRAAEAIDAPLRGARRRDRAGRPRRSAALARLGRVRPGHRLLRQRGRDAQPARGDAPSRTGGDVRLLLDQQGLRRPAQRPAARGPRQPARAARRPPLRRRYRHDDVDRHRACTRCSASPRPPPICSCRSTGATSACRPSASAAAA